MAWSIHDICGLNTSIPPERCPACQRTVKERIERAAPAMYHALLAVLHSGSSATLSRAVFHEIEGAVAAAEGRAPKAVGGAAPVSPDVP